MKPPALGLCVILATCGLFLLAACSNDLDLTVRYAHPGGLQPDDAVRMHGQQIGAVSAVDRAPQGHTAVRLRIEQAFRNDVTDACHFVLRQDGEPRGRQAVELVCAAAGGTPLAAGTEVEGRTDLGRLLDQGRRRLQEWTRQLGAELERWSETLEQLPVEDWAKQLEARIDDWSRDLKQRGDDVRRSFKQEVLPKLDEALKELERQLSEAQRHEDVERLERKLEKLKQM